MLSEKRIRAIVKDELKEQIRKQTIRMRVLASCNRVAERFGNPTGDSYYSKSEEIKEAITTKDDWRVRRELQLRAARECNRLLALIGIAKSSFHLKNKRIKFWTGKVLKVRGMIRSWNESDSKRYSKISE